MIRSLLVKCALFLAVALGQTVCAQAQGTLPISLVQQINQNGQPLAGCLVYFYVAGTVATPQNSFQDFGLTLPNPNPLACDQTGRVPLFWLANGLVHVRMTDATGLVVLDTTMQVLGPSSGGGGGGGSVDPTSVLSTGDIKFRATSETLTGWVKMSGLTIGSATSGATERANADTQNLFVYLWNNCHLCVVQGGKGGSALADFSANKQITVPDWRARGPIGLDNMDNSAAGILQSINVTSSGDTTTTPGATGGQAVHILTQGELPNSPPTGSVAISGTLNAGTIAGAKLNDASQALGTIPIMQTALSAGGGAQGMNSLNITLPSGAIATFTGNPLGNSTAHNVMSSFMLGTWFMKL